MNGESLARLEDFLARSAEELFASHGLALARLPGPAAAIEEPIAATIGFTAPEVQGAVLLTLTRELAARSLPASLRAGSPSPEIVVDWAGELSNQLLGRLKNRFCAVGVEIALGTPMVFTGKELRHFARTCPVQFALPFEGPCLIEFLGRFEQGFEIGVERAAAEDKPVEGEVLFF